MLYAKNLNMITPFAFERNLIVYTIANSKDVPRLTGCWESSGSYSTLSQSVTSPCPPILCPDGDVHNTVDNNQNVGGTSGRIKEGSNVPTSICSTMCHIVPQPTTTFQEDNLLMPLKWLDMTKLEEILVKVETLEHSAVTEFRKYRGSSINEVISVVVNEQFETGDACVSDYVDTAIANKGIFYTCSKCGNSYEKTQTCCPSCKNDPDNHDHVYDPYFRTESKHLSQRPFVYIGEPCMVNPNSIATVREVIEHVLDITHVKDPEHPRRWTIMHSDGVPYVYASELQDNLFVCNICGEEINKGDMRCEIWNSFLDEHKSKCSGSF